VKRDEGDRDLADRVADYMRAERRKEELAQDERERRAIADAFAERQGPLCTGCRLQFTECRCYVGDEP
jgi:hypothetical protein